MATIDRINEHICFLRDFEKKLGALCEEWHAKGYAFLIDEPFYRRLVVTNSARQADGVLQALDEASKFLSYYVETIEFYEIVEHMKLALEGAPDGTDRT